MLKLKKEANNYSPNMGVDDIEDIMSMGLDWTQDDFEFPNDSNREIDDASKLITIAQAEKIIGERPDASIPKPPTSKNPRPDTIKKYKEATASYKDRKKARDEWDVKFDRLVSLVQLLKNTKDHLDALREDLIMWCAKNPGTFIIRKSLDRYSLIQDPIEVLNDLIEDLHIPDEIKSLSERVTWDFDNLNMDEDRDIFPSVLITVGNNMLRIISISDDLHIISDALESFVDSVQPKNILSITNAQLDQKSNDVLKGWEREEITNSQLDEDKQELKLFLASIAFEKEIQQLPKYPDSKKVSDLVNSLLKEI